MNFHAVLAPLILGCLETLVLLFYQLPFFLGDLSDTLLMSWTIHDGNWSRRFLDSSRANISVGYLSCLFPVSSFFPHSTVAKGSHESIIRVSVYLPTCPGTIPGSRWEQLIWPFVQRCQQWGHEMLLPCPVCHHSIPGFSLSTVHETTSISFKFPLWVCQWQVRQVQSTGKGGVKNFQTFMC